MSDNYSINDFCSMLINIIKDMENPSYDIKNIIRERFYPIFQAYDKDGNSTINMNEFKSMLAENLGVSDDNISF